MSMKKRIQYVVAIAILAMISFTTSVMADPPSPDPGGGGIPGGGPGGGAPPIGAPVGDGVYFLIAIAMLYGFSRWYELRRQNTELA